MSNLLVEEKQIVYPGQVIANGMDFLPSANVLRDKDELVATKIGMISLNGRFVKIIPLTGPYVPRDGDIVIGRVTAMGPFGWRVNIGLPSEAVIPLKDGSSDYLQRDADLSKYYNFGDHVVAQVTKVYNGKLFDLTMKGPGLRKLAPGRLMTIGAAKVPRVIGKKGSMISMIKDHTNCKVSVGQNGIVWISGDEPAMEIRAVEAIRLIEKESHTSGLTDRVKEFLEKKK